MVTFTKLPPAYQRVTNVKSLQFNKYVYFSTNRVFVKLITLVSQPCVLPVSSPFTSIHKSESYNKYS